MVNFLRALTWSHLLLAVVASSGQLIAQGRYAGHTFSNYEAPLYSPESGTSAKFIDAQFQQSPQGYSQPQPDFQAAPYNPPREYGQLLSPGGPFQPASGVPGGFIHLDSPMTRPLLDFVNRQSEKEILLMSNGPVAMNGPEIVVGAQFRGSLMVGTTNATGKFPYLGRFPGDFVGNTVTDARMLQANQAVVGHLTPWAHGYMETLFSDVFTFPTFNQGSFQMRQAYVTFGDLSQSPLYAWIGKKNVNFGDMGTLSPFSQSMLWHYFGPLGEGAGIGASQDGLTVNFTALNGSRGIRVMDSEEKGHLNNFATNMRYEMPLADDVTWAVGGGFLYGTVYDGSVAEHTNPQIFGPRNSAWDANTQLVVGPWIFEAEIARTRNPWPVTNENVTAWRTEAAHDLTWIGQPLRASASFSEGTQGPGGSQFEFNRQFVAGLRYIPHPNVTMTFEYVRSTGFAPLIDITTVSDRSVIQNSFILGLVLAI
jgi:hypothetical protein